MTEAILEFKSVCFSSNSKHMNSFENLSFKLHSGNILMLHTDRDTEYTPVVDLCLGLIKPNYGSIRFMGTDWNDMDAFGEADNRGRIGCIFERPSWISNLSVFENIKLRERHHTTRKENEISDEVFSLADKLGINETDDLYMRPDAVSGRRLRVYEWVRATMGTPKAVLMSFPERGALSYTLDKLISLVQYLSNNGVAVIWMTDRDDIFNHTALSEWQINIGK